MKRVRHHQLLRKLLKNERDYYIKREIERLENENDYIIDIVWDSGVFVRIIEKMLGWFRYYVRMRSTFEDFYFLSFCCLLMDEYKFSLVSDWVIERTSLMGNTVLVDRLGGLDWPEFISDPVMFFNMENARLINEKMRLMDIEKFDDYDGFTNFMGSEEQSLRRVRIKDILLYQEYLGDEDRWWLSDKRNSTWNVNLFLLRECNNYAYIWLHSLEPEELSDRSKYRVVVGKVGDYIKRNFADVNSLCLVELKHLPGHQVVLEEFDPYAQVAPFIAVWRQKGANKRVFLKRFYELCQHRFNKELKILPPEQINFYNFFVGGSWESSGSSETKIQTQFELNGKVVKKLIKVRRNFLMAYLDYEDLIRRLMEYGIFAVKGAKELAAKKTAKMNVIIKKETGKIRFAYGTSDELLFASKYILYWYNKAYARWEGLDILRSPIQEYYDDMLFAITRGWYMFYDFKGFDTQIGLAEQCMIVGAMVNAIVQNYSKLGQEYFELIAMLKYFLMIICWSIYHFDMEYKGKSSLNGKVENIEFKIRVVNGLLSGVAFTSIFGGGFSTVGCDLAIMDLDEISEEGKVDLDQHNLGDDKQIRSKHWRRLEAINWIFSGYGYDAGVGKYGMLYNRGEFLRKFMVNGSKIGWVNRAINGICQQKPWRPEPPTDIAGLSAMLTNVLIVYWRSPDGRNILKWFMFHAMLICYRFGLDYRLLFVPEALGGLGLFIWTGEYIGSDKISGFIPRVQLPPVSKIMRDKYKNAFAELGIFLPDFVLDKSMDRMMLRKVTMSDVGELKPAVRRHYFRHLKGMKCIKLNRKVEVRNNVTKYINQVFNLIKDIEPNENYLYNIKRYFKQKLVLFGIVKTGDIFLLDLIDDDDLREFYKDEYVAEELATYVNRFSWNCGKKLILKFLIGNISLGGFVHPGLSEVLKIMLAWVFERLLHMNIGKYEYYKIIAHFSLRAGNWFYFECPVRNMFRY